MDIQVVYPTEECQGRTMKVNAQIETKGNVIGSIFATSDIKILRIFFYFSL